MNRYLSYEDAFSHAADIAQGVVMAEAEDEIFDAMVAAHVALNRANRIREINGITIRARITYDDLGDSNVPVQNDF